MTDEMEENLYNFVTSMPKVELHAHLNGSIGDKLLDHLKKFSEKDSTDEANIKLPNIDEEGILMNGSDNINREVWSEESNKARSLKECWEAFGKIHEVIKTPRILYVATVNVIAEFSRDNVIYLELRTGSKKVFGIPSKSAYMEAVVKGIEDAQTKFPIIVKLLVSINRGNGEQDAYENLDLAQTFAEKYPHVVVGIDVSGDPAKGHWGWIVKVMEEARKRKIKITCHLPEIVNPTEGLKFMKFGPERVGHGQFLHPLYGGTDELWKLTKESQIPIETCISSNLVSGVTKSLDCHIVKIFQDENIPFVICTDDSGVFRTSLSIEFAKLLNVCRMTLNDLLELTFKAVSYAFATVEEKSRLENQIIKWMQSQELEKDIENNIKCQTINK